MINTAVLDDRGFTTVPVVDGPDLAKLRTVSDGLRVDPGDPYFVSSVHASRAIAQDVDLELKRRLTSRLTELLPGHLPFMAAVISKGSGSGRVGLHPDWTYGDERLHRARIVWIPLVEATEANGAMVMVPASHRAMRGLRGSGPFPSPVEHIEEDLWAGHVETVPLAAGEAVVWDAALLHGSWPNTSAAPRPAAVIGLVPAESSLVHFHIETGGPVEGFAVDRAYFTAREYASRPDGYPRVEPWDEPVQPFASVHELLAPSSPSRADG